MSILDQLAPNYCYFYILFSYSAFTLFVVYERFEYVNPINKCAYI